MTGGRCSHAHSYTHAPRRDEATDNLSMTAQRSVVTSTWSTEATSYNIGLTNRV
jgi:hypothetical protein